MPQTNTKKKKKKSKTGKLLSEVLIGTLPEIGDTAATRLVPPQVTKPLPRNRAAGPADSAPHQTHGINGTARFAHPVSSVARVRGGMGMGMRMVSSWC